jgi:hypothetical protein
MFEPKIKARLTLPETLIPVNQAGKAMLFGPLDDGKSEN